MKVRFPVILLTFALVFGLCASVFADTIRLRDGSVIHGQIVGFKDGQFVVLIGAGARGRRSRVTLYVEDVESIEFDNANGGTTASDTNAMPNNPPNTDAASNPVSNNPRADDSAPRAANNSSTPTYNNDSSSTGRSAPPTSDTNSTGSMSNGGMATSNSPTSSAPMTNDTSVTPTSAAPGTYFPVSLRVRADNAPSGWTSSGIVVRRGQRLRITATGRVMLAGGQASTPAGVPRLTDKDKLMRDEATGALIAVIGDDNDDFIYIGNRREFIAQRDGVLFLGVNSGTLGQNSGAFDVTVEAEALSTSRK